MNQFPLRLPSSLCLSSQVQYRVCDITTTNYPEDSFDVIYSRDTILHIADKKSLFANFYRWLRPGGQLLITDYCQKAGQTSAEFRKFLFPFTLLACSSCKSESVCLSTVPSLMVYLEAYVASRGYNLLSPAAYGATIMDAGFDRVLTVNATPNFVKSLESELKRSEQDKEGFVDEFCESDYDYIVEGWRAKLVRCAAGDQKWGLFHATK